VCFRAGLPEASFYPFRALSKRAQRRLAALNKKIKPADWLSPIEQVLSGSSDTMPKQAQANDTRMVTVSYRAANAFASEKSFNGLNLNFF
jgi:hypothetical protein